MPKTPDPVRQLQGRLDYYRRASSYDPERIRQLEREVAAAKAEQPVNLNAPDPVRVLQGRRDYYRRAGSYDPERVREIERDIYAAKIAQAITADLPDNALPLTDEQIERLVALLRGAASDV